MSNKLTDRIKDKLDKFIVYLLLIIFALLSLSLYRNMARITKSKSTVDEAGERVNKLENEKKELEARLSEVSSEYYIEKQIRDKLNLTKEGEIMVILPPEDVLRKLAPKEEEKEAVLPDPNWRKWIKLFI
ncbi:MAG: Septum formation initiator [Candidatus Woesebacteria bacterium GW2011_GWA1_37_7]|uniref:Septum formation initiator n=1 Tax=Candidatus Woesebacteria bacterium GW2011_GWA1_37_7 TaxID=1618545 RepID=A0A0G0HCW3_9BACT|nr:MAG: Septum formation initiator [Candidatus Woesebacteria bacterium GW2011_GWA1_37_7]